MNIHGEFVNIKGRTVGLTISVPSGSADVEIGGGGNLDWGEDDVIKTDCGFNDPTDVIICHSATISLSARQYVPDLFARGYCEIPVEVTLDGGCVFSGFLEPSTYSQDYVSAEDDLELDCLDMLSVLQYIPYRNITEKDGYNTAVAEAGKATFRELIAGALSVAFGSGEYTVLYDGSRSADVDGATAATVFDDLSVSEKVFLGDGEDDVWTWQDVLESVLKFLNLHIVQEGRTLYIFSWESVRRGNISWIAIAGKKDGNDQPGSTIDISLDNVEGDSTKIDVVESFNKLSLKVSPKSVDTLVESPLDNMDSAYTKRMLYCREFRTHDLKEFEYWCRNGYLTTSNPVAYWQDWYALVKYNSGWTIGRSGNDMVDTYKKDDVFQENIVNQLAIYPGACLMSLGRVRHNVEDLDKKDNSPKSTLDMSDYMVISVSEADSGKTTNDPLVTPVAVYKGNNGGALLSPADNDTVNYIVISGSFRLESKMPQSVTYYDPTTGTELPDAPLGLVRWGLEHGHEIKNVVLSPKAILQAATVDSKDHAPAYLIYQWFRHPSADGRTIGGMTADYNPQGVAVNPANWPSEAAAVHFSNGLRMPSEFDGPLYEYEYNSIGDASDHLSKVSVLECMLIVGDKVLVEDMSKNGSIDALSWQPFKSMDECKALHPDDIDAAEDEFYSQTFAIGFDPKIGDHLLNEDHEVQTNFTWQLGIDTDKGMAIPVRHSDHLSGKVDFRILGVVNTFYFNKVTKRHRTWFRSEKWSEDAFPLMSKVRAVFIKDFSIKLYSDNAMEGNSGKNDGDMVYTSDTDESFYNKKDDIEFKIHSAFTTAECREQGISPVIAITTVTESASGDGCLGIKDNVTGETLKAEAEYVSEYYDELHLPRVTMTQSFQDNDGTITPWRHYHSPAMGKDFYVQSMSRNLYEGSAELNMKEIW